MGRLWDEKIRQIERQEPFTKEEKAAYQQRDLNFIRTLQVTENKTKAQAKKSFHKYINSSPKSKKKIRDKARNIVKNYAQYDSHAPKLSTGVHIPPSQPKQKKQASLKSKSPKVQKRLANATQKYPDASIYEKRHGVNSKASQEYRLRHGQGRFYEGRTIQKAKK